MRLQTPKLADFSVGGPFHVDFRVCVLSSVQYNVTWFILSDHANFVESPFPNQYNEETALSFLQGFLFEQLDFA